MSSANILIVIDMQNDFVTGSLGTEDAVNIVDNVCDKISSYINEDKVIYYTLDTHYNDYLNTFEGKNLPVPHCIYGENSHKLTPKVESLIVNYYNTCEVNKGTFGSFAWNNKMFAPDAGIDVLSPGEENNSTNYLKFVGGSIEICGLCTDICVISNALILRALYPDTPIIVDAKCCAGTTYENHIAAIKVMKSCQIDVINFDEKDGDNL